MKILIVDDSPMVRESIKEYLKGEDYEIVGEASNGHDAVEKLKETNPDIVTLDITMPEMDGLTCLEEMLKIKSNLIAIVVTAVAKKSTSIEALEKGAKHYLRKPFSEGELKEAFEAVCA